MTNDERMALVKKVLATQQHNVNAEDGDRHLKDANMALEVIEEIAFADSEFDLDLRKREGWFGYDYE